MLTFESPFYRIEDVVVFRDHAVKNQFYYLAGPPHLSKDANGKVEFSLLKYREALASGGAPQRVRDQLGGAFLMLGVDCSLPPTLLSTIKSQLSQYVPDGAGDVLLDPVLYTSGTVQIVCLDYTQTGAAMGTSASKIVRGVIGTSTPSLLQDLRAIFSVSLDTDGATLLEKAYDDELSPIGVMYNLQFSGLRPAISVRATADMKRIYHSLSMDLKLGLQSGGSSTTTGGTTTGGTTTGGTTTGGTTTGGTTTGGSSVSGGGAQPAARTQEIHVKIQTAGDKTAMRFNVWLGPTAPNPMPAGLVAAGGEYVVPNGNGKVVFGAGNFNANDEFVVGIPPGNAVATPTHTGTGTMTFVPNNPTTTGTTTTTAGSPNNSTPPGANTQGSGGGFGLDADIQYMMQKLVEEGAIKIEIIRQAEGQSVDAMQTEAMSLLKEDILRDFFHPTTTLLPSSPTAPSAPGGTIPSSSINQSGTRFAIGFQLQMKDENDLKTETFEYDVQSPETRTHAPNGFFATMLAGTDRAALIRDIDLDDPFFKTLVVEATTIADFGAIGLREANISMEYGSVRSEPMLFTPADLHEKYFQAFLDGQDASYKYLVSYSFGASETIAAPPDKYEYATEQRTTVERSVVIDPLADVPMLHLYVDQGVVDWEIVKSIEATIAYTDGDYVAQRTYLVDQNFHRQEWTVRLANPEKRAYTVQCTWILRDTEQRIVGAPVTSTAPQVFVFDPFVDRLPIVVQPEVDPTSVVAIAIDFHYKDPKSGLEFHKLVQLAPPYRTTQVFVPIMDKKHRSYGYSVSLVKANAAQSENRPEVQTEAVTIDLLEGVQRDDVRVQILGDVSVGGKVAGIQVDVRTAPADGQQPAIFTHVFDPSVPSDKLWTQRVSFRTDLAERTWEYRTTAFLANGSAPIVRDWAEAQDMTLVLQPPRLLEAS